MIDLKQARSLVCDRQPASVRSGDARSRWPSIRRQIAARPGHLRADPGEGGLQAGADHARGDPRAVPGSQRAPNCVGLITWMHTFSPAKMWIAGLEALLKKPFVHLHTQYNRDIPWVGDRHGFHEPEPVGPRRPRVRLHRHAACA